MRRVLPLVVALAAARAQAQTPAAAPKKLTLEEALQTAATHQPTVRQAQANVEVSRARADEAFAPILPQVNANASYSRQTSNYAAKPGAAPNGINSNSKISWDTANYFSGGLNAQATLWDFEQSWGKYHAAQANARAQGQTELATEVQVALNVRTAYFTARAQKDLVDVATATLQNQQAHLKQIQGFVEVGTRPEIDLAQAKSDVANARVQQLQAMNNYATAKAKLNVAMGIEGPTDYDLADIDPKPVGDEDAQLDQLVDTAYKARPESGAYEAQLEAERYTLQSIRGAYYPSLGASLGFTLAGQQLAHLAPNANGQLTLNWQLYGGGITNAQVREAGAQLMVIEAQRDAFRQQVRLDVEQAQLAVKAAREELVAADEALVNARERLRLAEGRYQAGVGNIIELGDAQVALTNTAAQRVQAFYNLATSRAQLIAAIGQR